MKVKEFHTTDLWFPDHTRYKVIVKNVRAEDGKNEVEILEQTKNPKTNFSEVQSFKLRMTDEDVKRLAAGLLESIKDY
jgi:hypothetical protein